MATTPIAYPLTEGSRHSFVSIEAKFKGQIFPLKSVNYSRTRSRTMVMANHPDPIGKTRGSNAYKADAEFYLAEFHAFKALLVEEAGGSGGYGDIQFDVTVTYNENGFDTQTDVITGCTLDSTDASNSQGDDPTVRKIELNPTKIKFDGDDDVTVPLSRAFSTAA